MNLDDLRAELNARANDADTHPRGRMDGIRAKAAQRRRRKTVAVVAGVVLIVGTVIGVPALSRLLSEPAPVDSPDGPFPEQVNGDTLIAQAMGDKGDRSVTLTFTPDDTDFLLDFDCEGETETLMRAVTRTTVNGKRINPGCGLALGGPAEPVPAVGSGVTRDDAAGYWEARGIGPGERVTVTLTFLNGRDLPRGRRLGIAAYEMTGRRVEESGIALSEERTVGGRTYRLADGGYDVTSAGEVRASVDIPALGDPALVVYGSTRFADIRVTGPRIEGKPREFTCHDDLCSDVLDSTKTQTLDVEKLSSKSDARAFAAYYTLVDD